MDDPAAFLKKYYAVPPPYEGVYVLGCFARHVTLYSQQVRALNLIYALHKAGKLPGGVNVAIVGGGAAGLTASVAAASKGATVTLLEKFEDLMELQQNNRQRWIHPYIYDWPYISDQGTFDEVRGDAAQVPFLPWTADYAANVASNIVRRWRGLQSAFSIRVHYPVSDIDVPPSSAGKVSVHWTEHQYSPPRTEFDIVILAVGFGLEKHSDVGLSYWMEDDFDSGLHRAPLRWLISGSGDGAMIDLMRICMRRFRQAEIQQEFATASGIEAVKTDLARIMQDPRSATEEGMSKLFENELTIPSSVEKVVQDRIRKNPPRITWVTRTPHIYGPMTSVMNRLIVRIIMKHVPITLKIGSTNERRIRRQKRIFLVPIEPVLPICKSRTDARQNRVSQRLDRVPVDRVLIRHGPESALKAEFSPIFGACEKLIPDWKSLSITTDETRKSQWEPEFFVERGEFSSVGSHMGKEFGLAARAVTVYKDVRGDGSSTVTFEIKDLSVDRGELSGVHFYYQSKAGRVGPPRLLVDPPRTTVSWVNDMDSASADSVDPTSEMIEYARRLSGIVHFKTPLTTSSQSVSIGLTFTVQNGDALSTWEFAQMYAADSRDHMDESELGGAIEYFARIVWFPTEMLRLRISLPNRLSSIPYPTVFIPTRNEITPSDVTVESVLQFSPSAPSKWRPSSRDWKPELFGWKRDSPYRLLEQGCFTMPTSHTWELTVRQPVVGSCYSLDWPLQPAPENEALLELVRGAKLLREALRVYSEKRRTGQESEPDRRVRALLLDLDMELRSRYALDDPTERFQVQMMTYIESQRRLVVVDAVIRGGEPDESTRKFSLPFGLGLAGSCFRQAQAFVYRASDARTATGYANHYLPIPRGEEHECLLALPLDHPALTEDTIKKLPVNFERSQQSIGVMNISSNHPATRLLQILHPDEITAIRNLCQRACDSICSDFNLLRE